jgi:hypothetical protein
MAIAASSGVSLDPTSLSSPARECFAELDRYVELELRQADADAKVPGMRAHLEGCGACDEDHRSLRALIETEMVSMALSRRQWQ